MKCEEVKRKKEHGGENWVSGEHVHIPRMKNKTKNKHIHSIKRQQFLGNNHLHKNIIITFSMLLFIESTGSWTMDDLHWMLFLVLTCQRGTST